MKKNVEKGTNTNKQNWTSTLQRFRRPISNLFTICFNVGWLRHGDDLSTLRSSITTRQIEERKPRDARYKANKGKEGHVKDTLGPACILQIFDLCCAVEDL